MPTFFNKDSLTPEQKQRYESAVIEYDLIQENNAKYQFENLTKAQLQKLKLQLNVLEDQQIQEHFLKMVKLNTPNEKSSLFFRLLNNQKPLRYPPPCSYSYPWYAVIEQDKTFELFLEGNTIDDLSYSEKNRVIIDQTSWEIIEKSSKDSALISYGDWKNIGFIWKLSREKIACKDSSMHIVSHHNEDLDRITTLGQLKEEQKFHVLDDVRKIKLILEPETQEKQKQYYINKYGEGFGSGVFETELTGAQYMLETRRSKGLTDYPNELEIDNMINDRVNEYLEKEYSTDDNGNLYITSWTLKRILPEKLPNIYQDEK